MVGMARPFQFRVGCIFWLAAAVALILTPTRIDGLANNPRNFGVFFGVFVVVGIGLIIWGAFLISEKE